MLASDMIICVCHPLCTCTCSPHPHGSHARFPWPRLPKRRLCPLWMQRSPQSCAALCRSLSCPLTVLRQCPLLERTGTAWYHCAAAEGVAQMTQFMFLSELTPHILNINPIIFHLDDTLIWFGCILLLFFIVNMCFYCFISFCSLCQTVWRVIPHIPWIASWHDKQFLAVIYPRLTVQQKICSRSILHGSNTSAIIHLISTLNSDHKARDFLLVQSFRC